MCGRALLDDMKSWGWFARRFLCDGCRLGFVDLLRDRQGNAAFISGLAHAENDKQYLPNLTSTVFPSDSNSRVAYAVGFVLGCALTGREDDPRALQESGFRS